jgi:peptidoglycan/LPS O-acetylase OafA/YrhL
LGEYAPLSQTLGFTLNALTFTSLLALAVTAPPQHALSRFAATPLLRLFGQYSYGLYLFHGPILGLLRRASAAPLATAILGPSVTGNLVFTVAFLGASLLAAMASYHLFERRFLALKDSHAKVPVPN